MWTRLRFFMLILAAGWVTAAMAETYTWPPISPDEPMAVLALEVRGPRLIIRRPPPRPNRRPVPKIIRLTDNVKIDGLPAGRSLRMALPAFVEILEVQPGTSSDELVVTHLRWRTAVSKDIIDDVETR